MGSIICSSRARVSLSCKCFGPLASAVMKGRLMSVSRSVERSILAFLGGLFEPLQGHLVAGKINPLLLLEFSHDPLNQHVINVVAAQVRVAVGGLDFDDTLADFQNRNVKGAAPEVVNGNRLVLLLVKAIGQRRRRRLIDDSRNLKPGDLSGIFPWPAAVSR